MHTSDRLISENFAYRRLIGSTWRPVDFAEFCPDYHEQDRLGVVSPNLEEGVLYASHTLLATITKFYDELRSRFDDFYDYPQHFAFVGRADTSHATENVNGDESGSVRVGGDLLPLDHAHLWDAWSWLDVWPDAKWVTTSATQEAMLRRVFDY